MAHTIVLDYARNSADRFYANGKQYLIYHLAQEIHLGEPHHARLVSFNSSELANTAYVFADFVKPQPMNDGLYQILGMSKVINTNIWVPVTVDPIPSVGTLTIARRDGNPVGDSKTYYITIQLVPDTWLNGGTKSCGDL